MRKSFVNKQTLLLFYTYLKLYDKKNMKKNLNRMNQRIPQKS